MPGKQTEPKTEGGENQESLKRPPSWPEVAITLSKLTRLPDGLAGGHPLSTSTA